MLRTRRIELLSLIELAVGDRQPIPAALERFAAADPGLAQPLRRIAKLLQSGMGLGSVLAQCKVLDQRQAQAIDSAAQPAAALRRLCQQLAREPVPDQIVRWYPVWLAAAVIASPALLNLLLNASFGGMQPIYKDLGIALPGLTEFYLKPWWQVWPCILALLGIIAAIVARMHRTGALDWWCPLISRWRCETEILETFSAGSTTSADWRTLLRRWTQLCSRTLSADDQRLWKTAESLEDAARRLGIATDRVPDSLEMHLAHARMQHKCAVRFVAPMLTTTLAGLAIIVPSFINYLPLVKITESISAGGGGSRDSAFWLLIIIPAGTMMALASIITAAPSLLDVLPGVPRSLVATIGASLSSHLRHLGLPQVALHAVRSRVSPLQARRIRACIAALESPQPPPLIDALVQHRLLPAELLASGRAALSHGPQALIQWCDLISGPAQRNPPWWTVTAPYLACFSIFIAVFGFIGITILPKIAMLIREMGIRLSNSMALIIEGYFFLERWWWLITPSAFALLAFAVAASRRIDWSVQGRLMDGLALLSGISAGHSEGEIARTLANARPRSADILLAAGASGDFRSLCRCCGWNARTPAELAQRITNAQRRLDRFAAILRTGIEVAMPLLLAIPVGLIAHGFFSSLYGIVTTLAAE